jgi:hypothetical protein
VYCEHHYGRFGRLVSRLWAIWYASIPYVWRSGSIAV